jgi:hypothetical protein
MGMKYLTDLKKLQWWRTVYCEKCEHFSPTIKEITMFSRTWPTWCGKQYMFVWKSVYGDLKIHLIVGWGLKDVSTIAIENQQNARMVYIFSICSTYVFWSCLTIIRVYCYRVSNTMICAFFQGVVVYKYILHMWYVDNYN